MKRTYLIALAVVIIIGGLLVHLSKTGTGQKGSRESNATAAPTPALPKGSAEAGKEGQETGGAQPQTQPQEEAPSIEIPL
ncbi:MAG TPA: hypothetical protein VMH06_03625, partial [Thermodesulfovibrionales bacterium]|nr:hypothetical protein [Thermodesulfovibrionales bacterium]